MTILAWGAIASLPMSWALIEAHQWILIGAQGGGRR